VPPYIHLSASRTLRSRYAISIPSFDVHWMTGPASREPVRVRDFFLDISGLYIVDMADDADANTNLNANANVNPLATPYAICFYLFQFLLQLLVLEFEIDVICLSMLDVICLSILLVCMIRLISAIIIMLYYWLFRIKSYDKMLIYSTYYDLVNTYYN
jgi:hypothetical protein